MLLLWPGVFKNIWRRKKHMLDKTIGGLNLSKSMVAQHQRVKYLANTLHPSRPNPDWRSKVLKSCKNWGKFRSLVMPISHKTFQIAGIADLNTTFFTNKVIMTAIILPLPLVFRRHLKILSWSETQTRQDFIQRIIYGAALFWRWFLAL